jgi:hypothetical protein
MNLPEAYLLLPDKKKDQVYDTMLEAGLSYQNGKNWREVFRRAKHQCRGNQSRIYRDLEQADYDAVERMINGLLEYSE